MKRFSKLRIFMPLVAASLLYNCGGSDDSVFTPPVDIPASTPKLIVTEAGTGDKREITVNSDKLATPVLVKFKTETNSMRRLYITSNVNGLGDKPYTFENPDVDSKKDGSVDLKSDTKKELEYSINFPTPTEENSTIVYKLWTTTGRGDFRNAAKRNAIPVGEGEAATVGTITIKKGTGGTSGNVYRKFENVQLAVPTDDFTSKTFFSLYNGNVYKIADGISKEDGAELINIWDFGYLYDPNKKDSDGNTIAVRNATLSAVSKYRILGIPKLADFVNAAEGESLNNVYFKKSPITTAQFDAITDASGIQTSVSTSDALEISNLKTGDIVEVLDQYGNTGLLKITKIEGTYNQNDYIKFDLKMK